MFTDHSIKNAWNCANTLIGQLLRNLRSAEVPHNRNSTEFALAAEPGRTCPGITVSEVDLVERPLTIRNAAFALKLTRDYAVFHFITGNCRLAMAYLNATNKDRRVQAAGGQGSR
jgi:hypothetical protein